jgi:hypothetical protein
VKDGGQNRLSSGTAHLLIAYILYSFAPRLVGSKRAKVPMPRAERFTLEIPDTSFRRNSNYLVQAGPFLIIRVQYNYLLEGLVLNMIAEFQK